MRRKELFIALYLCCTMWGQAAERNCEREETSSTALEIAEILIKKTEDIIPDCAENTTNKSECGAKAKMMAFLNIAKKLIAQSRENSPTCKDDITEDRNIKKTEHPKSRDCSEVLQNGQNTTGVYTICLDSPSLKNRTLSVFCDMQDDGGGWTVIQRRGNFIPQEDFFRNWKDYKNGFGTITKDFWIGNEKLYALTKQAEYSVKFVLEDVSGNKTYAFYDIVWIEDERTNYRLHIHGYSGTAGDAMADHNNAYFSTRDRDNDNYFQHCARDNHHGGWWFSTCGNSYLNGRYLPGVDSWISMFWLPWTQKVGLAATEIKLRRKYD